MKINFKKIIIIGAILLLFGGFSSFLFLDPVRAQAVNEGFNYVDNGDLGISNADVSDPRVMLVNIVRFALTFIGIIAVAVILYGGFLWMTAAGNAQKVDKAKKTLISALIGLVVIISALVIIQLVFKALEGTVISGCSDGDTRSCGCGGVQTCAAGSWGTCIGSDCSIPVSVTSFQLRYTLPHNEDTGIARNTVVKAFFNKALDDSVTQATLNENFTIEKIADVDPNTFDETPVGPIAVAVEDIAASANRKGINMQASADCLDENETSNCFGAWSRFRVSINDGIDDLAAAGPQSLDCGNGLCHFEFITSDLIDTAGPTAGILPAQICHDDGSLAVDANIAGFWCRDDVGISEIRFFEQRVSQSRVLRETIAGTMDRYQFSEYQYDTAAMLVGDTYTFSGEADDMAGDTADDGFTAVIREGHCCNGILDGDEEEIDCGGPDCDSCFSRDPVILWFSPDNGTSSNWITIGGRYFGNTEGEVYFSDGSGGWVGPAQFPAAVNTNCVNDWQDRQIIVIVPASAATGPVKVVRSDAKEDASDDVNGPLLTDFEINVVSRPGLCLVAPDFGFFEQTVDFHGTAFSGSGQGIFFGNEADNTEANSSAWEDQKATANVPNLLSGRTTVFARSNSENSNYLYFDVEVDSAALPVIDYIDPPEGPVGQYITIFGSNFKTHEAGTSQVFFTYLADGTEYTADGFDFPLECQDSWWHDRQIIVKVPDGIADGAYEVKITNRLDLTSLPEDFTVTTGAPGPGICLLDPDNGPPNTGIKIIGDNFNNTQGSGFARFYNNVQVDAVTSWSNQKIELDVPAGAETGPIAVSDGSDLSNTLEFRVGTCSIDDDCESGEECCGGGTFWAGICRGTGTCGEGGVGISGYGWTFSTGGTPTEPLVCGGFSALAECAAAGNCPNSLGVCQTRTDLALGIECSDSACNDSYSVCQDSCSYNVSNNRCEADSAPLKVNCDFINTSYPEAVCRLVNSQGVWQINAGGSCPLGSYLDVNGWCTLGVVGLPDTCQVCDGGFSCSAGICTIPGRICPDNSECSGGECLLENPICECCCDTLNNSADCCAGLTCVSGNCGDDPQYGLCSGCRVDLNGNPADLTSAEQAASDQACLCEGTTGKYCEILDPSDPNDLGVCKDATPCDNDIYDPGCDPNSSMCGSDEYCDVDCFCKKGKPCDNDSNPTNGCGAVSNCDPATEYCDPNDCFCKKGKPCDDDANPENDCNAVSNCDSDEYCDSNCLCQPDIPPGDPCDENPNPNVAECDPDHCGTGYECLPVAANDCGSCCCNLDNANTEDDTCRDIDEDLYCAAVDDIAHNCYDSNIATAPNFGICCGCSADADCSGGTNHGCGDNSCCYGRPDVVPGSEVPPDDSGAVCRNTAIEAEFDQAMDIASFSGEVLVLGDYGFNECPEGTTYLARGQKKEKKYSIFKKAAYYSWKKLRSISAFFWPGNNASAYTVPDVSHNFCAVKGSSGGYTNAAGNSVLQFFIDDLLDPDRLYYAIIKGDKDLDSTSGVLSRQGIGLNSIKSPSYGEPATFNDITYENSYIWSFKTLPEQGEDTGVCELSQVKIEPETYLFQTTEAGINENDVDAGADTFDTVADNDKVFAAKAMNSQGQVIAPTAGYGWDWLWGVDNNNIVDLAAVADFPGDGNKQLVRAQSGAVEGKAVISATANSTVLAPGYSPFSRLGQADAYVFICNNPWPPVGSSGLWEPWRDSSLNCMAGAGACHNTNYEIYYCRDFGSDITYDDLPAIVSDNTVSRRETLACSEGGALCADAGDPCGPTNSGKCEIQVLKESFFFSAEKPDVSSIVLAGSAPAEGALAELYWNDLAIVPPGEFLSAYKIYYGKTSGEYSESLDVSLADSHSLSSPFLVSGLDNGETYYFAVTALFATGAESDFSNEIELSPVDTDAPLAPANLVATPKDGEVELSWDSVSGADSYKVFYGVNSGIYGNSENIGNVTEVVVTGLNNGQTYYFAVKALDEDGNESLYSNEEAAIPDEVAMGMFASGEIILTWNVSGSGIYEIYLEEIE